MLRNILLVVNDVEKSKQFYQEYFGLHVIRDFDGNVMLTEGLVLQERKIWEETTGRQSVVGNTMQLFFEERSWDVFYEKIEKYLRESQQPSVVRVNSWGKRVLMLQDLDGHWIEVAE
jgi:catechol 2,3-dioxygenase-like lactoylglutathione lyase family enzyme